MRTKKRKEGTNRLRDRSRDNDGNEGEDAEEVEELHFGLKGL